MTEALSRRELHEQADEIVRRLVQRFGTDLPADVETTLRYYLGCRAGVDRAARDVLALAGLLGDRRGGR